MELAEEAQKSLKEEFITVGTNSPRKGRIPLLKRIFFPWTELHPGDLLTCPKEAECLEALNLAPNLFFPQSQQPAWDVNIGLWRAVRPIQPITVSLYDIITGNRIMAKPMKN